MRAGARLGRSAVWLLLIGASGLLVRGEVRGVKVPDGVVAHKDLVYRTVGRRHALLDVYVPDGVRSPSKRPAVLAIHGGGWRGGSKRDYGLMAAQLVRHGYVVVAVDYLLSRPGSPSWPANFEDVREAVRWTRRHADEYGIDTSRIVALGASAGGHLAAMLGTDAEGRALDQGNRPRSEGPDVSAGVQAVIGFYGPSDLRALEAGPTAPAEALHLMLGGSPLHVGDRYDRASPVRHVSPGDPPMLLLHGADDTHVPPDQSRAMARALADAGVAHRLVEFPRFRHGFGFQHDDRDLLPTITTFLESVWEGRAQSPLRQPEPAGAG